MDMTLCRAMAREEGFGVPHSRSTRNNNPGDIEWSAFAEINGATRIETVGPNQMARFAYFPSVEIGFAAMRNLLFKHYKGMTVEQMLNKYAPPIENATNSYIKNVCLWVGCKPADIIDNLL